MNKRMSTNETNPIPIVLIFFAKLGFFFAKKWSGNPNIVYITNHENGMKNPCKNELSSFLFKK